MVLVTFINLDTGKELAEDLNLNLIPRVGEIVELQDINYKVLQVKHKYGNIAYRIVIIVKLY